MPGKIFQSRIARRLAWAPALFLLCLLAQCQLDGTPDPREENYVTVHLHDSLKRYDSVEIVLLAAGDSTQVVGKVWTGALPDPSAIPPYRLADGEDRPLTVRVRGFDSAGRMQLNLSISKTGGTQVVADLPLPGTGDPGNTGDTSKPVPASDSDSRLADLSVTPGGLSPQWDTAVYGYDVVLAFADSVLTLTATTVSAKAIVLAGGDTLTNAKSATRIKVGPGETTLTVRSINKKRESDYTLKVTRPDGPDDDNEDFPAPLRDWKYRGYVLINLKSLGMDRTWSEAGIPIVLRLTKDNFDFFQAAGDGRDVRIAYGDGKAIPFEIERWDAKLGKAEIWIHADLLRASDDTVRYQMYWGNSKAASASDGATVFPASESNNGIYHLSEQGTGASDEYRNSTGRLHGQGGGGDSKHVPLRVEGVVGYAQDFHPALLNYQATIALPKEFDPGVQSWTFQAWVKRRGYTNDASIFQKTDTWNAADQRFMIKVYKDNSRLSVDREGKEGLTDTYIPGGQFIHLGVVYYGGRFDVFVDGFLRESGNWTQGGDPAARCLLGATYADGSRDGFDGLMDEVWISSTPRSPMWMRVTFENQKTYSTFVTLKR